MMFKLVEEKASEGPAIAVGYAATDSNRPILSQILFGLEEEEIPFVQYQYIADDKTIDNGGCAYELACKSRLSLGIFIGADNSIALHHKNLLNRKPYLFFHGRELSMEEIREIGSSAGKIVKNLPLRIKGV